MTLSHANEHKLIKLNILLPVKENKYYVKSLKSDTVKSKNIVDLCKKTGEKHSTEEELDSNGEDSEKSSDIEANDEVYGGYHFSSS